jgi:hypothetical protein
MQLIPNAKQQFIDQNGAPLANGTVGFYAPGTLNPKATYQDAAGTIPNTNPVSLDSRGQALIWGSGVYRQIVKDCNGVTIWDQVTEDPTSALVGTVTDARYVAGVDFTAGTTTTLTLPANPGTSTNAWVFFDSAFQSDDQYTINGTTLTFTAPIPVGVQAVNVKIGTTIAAGTPGAGSVSDSAIASGSKVSNRVRDLVSVTDFGGVSGSAVDNTAAFAAACASQQGPVIVPAGGSWKVSGAPLYTNSLGLYDNQPASSAAGGNTFHSLRYVNSTLDTAQHANISAQTEVAATAIGQEIGLLSVINVHGGTSLAQTHVGTYTQVNTNGNFSGFAEGYNSEIGNISADGTKTTGDNALIGFESDIKTWTKYTGVDSAQVRKTGYSAVAWGGGDCTEGFALYAAGGINGVTGNYTSGDWIYGLIMRTNSLHVTQGIGIEIQSNHAQGIHISGSSVAYGINLAGGASAGNVGLNIGSGYSVGIAMAPNQPIQLNGAGNAQGISYVSGHQSISLSAPALEVVGHTTYATAGGVVGYLGVYVNGTLYKVPFQNV